MKKLLFLLSVGLIFAGNAQATGGTCSDHGGVDCAALIDWDGSAICNDGWRDSSEIYLSTKECENNPICTDEQYSNLIRKFDLENIKSKYVDLLNQYNSVDINATKSILNAESGGSGEMTTSFLLAEQKEILRQAEIKKFKLSQEMQPIKYKLISLITSVNDNCLRFTYNQESAKCDLGFTNVNNYCYKNDKI